MARADDEDVVLMESSIDEVVSLVTAPDEVLVPRLQAFLRELLTSRHGDGSWVPSALIQDILRSTWMIIDDRLTALATHDPRSDAARLVDAWRSCAEHASTLDRLLDQLRADQDAIAVPRNYLIDDLAELGEPTTAPDSDPDLD